MPDVNCEADSQSESVAVKLLNVYGLALLDPMLVLLTRIRALYAKRANSSPRSSRPCTNIFDIIDFGLLVHNQWSLALPLRCPVNQATRLRAKYGLPSFTCGVTLPLSVDSWKLDVA